MDQKRPLWLLLVSWVILVCLVVGWLFVQKYRQNRWSQEQGYYRQVEEVSGLIAAFVQKTRVALVAAAGAGQTSGGRFTVTPAFITYLDEAFLGDETFFFADEGGNVTAGQMALDKLEHIGETRYFQEAKNTGTMVISDKMVSPAGEEKVVIVLPVFKEGHFQGVMGAAVSTVGLKQMLEEVHLNPYTVVRLTDGAGNVLVNLEGPNYPSFSRSDEVYFSAAQAIAGSRWQARITVSRMALWQAFIEAFNALQVSLLLFLSSVVIGASFWVRWVKHHQNALAQANQKLARLAERDTIPVFYNHRYFHQRLGVETKKASQRNRPLSLVMLDLVQFGLYNKQQGYEAGDRLLEDLARLIQDNVGQQGILCRTGADEIAIILPGVDSHNACQFVKWLREKCENCNFPGQEQLPAGKITFAAGIAVFPTHAGTKTELLEVAQRALYNAKNRMKDKLGLYHSVFDQLEESVTQSEAEMVSSIKTLVSVINAKDQYTYGHTERVAQYAILLGEQLGMPVTEIKKLKFGALLHDIGKIEIGISILNKKEKLTDQEFELIKKHPVIGANILRPFKTLKEILPIVLYHHERFDGQGYPQGLKGNSIPLGARILAIADSFDAMTTDRPYKPAMSLEQAREELLRCAGKQFDPELVQEFIKVIDSGKLGVDISVS